jgi:hypothetical protein
VIQVSYYFEIHFCLPFVVNAQFYGFGERIEQDNNPGIGLIHPIEPTRAVERLNHKQQKGEEHKITGGCKIKPE